jgi:hypothetical protein
VQEFAYEKLSEIYTFYSKPHLFCISRGRCLLFDLAPASLEVLTDIELISNLKFVNPDLCNTRRSEVKFASARLDQQYEVLQIRARFNCNET